MQRARSLQDLSKGFPETRDTKPFTVNRDGYIDSRTVLNRKFIKITEEAVSTDEEDAIISSRVEEVEQDLVLSAVCEDFGIYPLWPTVNI